MILNFPTGRQTFDYDCGAKALQLVMAYYGVDIREDILIVDLSSGEHGTFVKDIIKVANTSGFNVIAADQGTPSLIREFIDMQQPVIMLLQAWADKPLTIQEWIECNEHGHYVVAIGYEGDKFIFVDPANYLRAWLSESELMARWHFTAPEGQINYDRYYIVLTGKNPDDLKRLVHMG